MKTVLLATGNHPIYENLVKHPPSGFKYTGYTQQSEFENLSVYSRQRRFQKKVATELTKGLGIPRMFFYRQRADLIHSSRGVLVLNQKPWIIDVEHAASFTGMHYDALKKAKRAVEMFLNSKHCKAILPHCKAAERSMLSFFGGKWRDKMRTIYPAVEWEDVDRKKRDRMTILFIGNVFDKKGGMEVLKAFSVLERKHDARLIMKSPVPEAVKARFDSDNIQFIDERLSRKQIGDLYRKADVFVMPTHMDTFGYVFLEAMGFGLPLIGTNIFAVPEMIEDGDNGFLIDTKHDWALENGLPDPRFTYGKALSKKNSDYVTRQMVQKLAMLAEDSTLRKRMGKSSLEMARRGRFSIKERNRNLKEVYETALGGGR